MTCLLQGQLAGSGSLWDSNRDVTISALRVQQKRLLLERHSTLAELQQLSKAYCKEEVSPAQTLPNTLARRSRNAAFGHPIIQKVVASDARCCQCTEQG